jgi:hypothetical protein
MNNKHKVYLVMPQVEGIFEIFKGLSEVKLIAFGIGFQKCLNCENYST